MKDTDVFSEGETNPLSRIMDYVYMVREYWMLGAIVGVTLGSIFCLFMYSRVPVYRSSLQLFVDLTEENILDVDEVVDHEKVFHTWNANAIMNHYQIELESRKLRDYVISQLDKQTIDRIVKPYRTPELAEPSVSGIIKRAIRVDLDLDRKLYTVSATHRDAKVAADLVNLYVTHYLIYNLSDVGLSNNAALSFLRKNVEEIQESILGDQLELQRLQKKNNIISIDESRSIIIDKITNLSTRRTELNVNKQSFETIIEQLKFRGFDVNGIEGDAQIAAALEISEVSQFGGVRAIKTALDSAFIEQSKIELLYLEKHPKHIQNSERIIELRSQLEDEIYLGIKSFLASSDKIEAQIGKINDSIKQLEDEAKRLDNLSIVLISLEAKIENSKARLAQIESRITETKIASQLSKANMKIIDEAVKSSTPSYPNNKYTIATAIFLFCISLIGLPIGIGLVNNKLRTPWDVEEFIRKPLLGEIVPLKKKQQQNIQNLITQPDSGGKQVIDSFRSIYKTIKLGTSNADCKIQVVTSTIPDEGKTVVSINYAAICAQHDKRVLLIDCDLRKPQISNYTGTTSDTGLVDWFDNGADLSERNHLHKMLGIHQLDSGVYLLPAGKATDRSTELTESQKFRQLIDHLSKEFDYIIIDTPPLKTFPDAMFIADYAQDVIFVCRFNKVSRSVVKRLIERLDSTAATVCGVIINQRKVKHKDDGYYGYYGSKY